MTHGSQAPSPVQRVAAIYAVGSAPLADVLGSIETAHQRWLPERSRASASRNGTPGETDSWWGVTSEIAPMMPQGRLQPLMEAYGPFAAERGWVVEPADGEGSNRDPDNPFYLPNPFAVLAPEARKAVLYGVGLADAGEVLRSLALNGVGMYEITGVWMGHKLSDAQYFGLDDAYFAEPRAPRERDPRVPAIHYAHDVDGVRFAIIDANEADMSGWQAEITYVNRTSTQPFELGTAWRSPDGWYLAYALGDEIDAWLTVAESDRRTFVLITPDGERISI